MRIRAATLAVVAAAATLSATAAPAFAAGTPQRVSAPIYYGDLNLRAAAGRAELQERVEAAARRLCSQHVGQSLAEMNYRRNCRADAVESASIEAAAIAG